MNGMKKQTQHRSTSRSSRAVVKQRDTTIDYLRSISIIIMIVLHINPYFPRQPFTSWFINVGQWVVPAFILCSLAVGSTKQVVDIRSYLSFLWRRSKRLLIPYYVWLISYLALYIVLGHKHLTWKSVVPNLTLTGGIDFNWLVLLFLYITIALPFLEKLVERAEKWSSLFLFFCACLSIYFVWNRALLSSAYRLSMPLPWYGVTIGLLLFLKWIRSNQRRKIILLLGLSLLTYEIVVLIFSSQHISLNTFNHKYPPDIFYFSYCLWTSIVAYGLVKMLTSHIPSGSLLTRFLQYVSVNSYPIFFTHLVVLYILDVGFPRRPFSYSIFSVLTFGGTFVILQVIKIALLPLKQLVMWNRS